MLRELAARGAVRDRAFVDAMIRMAFSRSSDDGEQRRLEALHEELRRAARASHAELRAAIANGSLRGTVLRKTFERVPFEERDHFVEEVLGIAYPPLDETAVEQDVMAYLPSGYGEIVHALDATHLGAKDCLVDVGSGAGKVVMLAALLAGASAEGIERDETLHDVAASAAQELGLIGTRFIHGDARDASFDHADVVFMYLPFTGAVLDTVLDRLGSAGRASRARGQFLCAGALDLASHPDLTIAGPPRSWLNVYARASRTEPQP